MPHLVASLAEAWIEILGAFPLGISHRVASLAEAWIEIFWSPAYGMAPESPPSRRRGLKSV